MKIAVWKTGHNIADTIARSMATGSGAPIFHTSECCEDIIQSYDAHIAYGILRGTSDVYKLCDKYNKPWFNVDRGYFNPAHFSGYYRVSLRGTQQTTNLDKIPSDIDRLDTFNLNIKQHSNNDNRNVLFVPPSNYIADWIGININDWIYAEAKEAYLKDNRFTATIRYKGTDKPLREDLDQCGRVVVFNSGIAWEALLNGLEVKADSNYSIVGAYQKTHPDLHQDYRSRLELFGKMAGLQLNLHEMENGKLCQLLDTLLSH